MEFRTEISLPHSEKEINHCQEILLVGSCFTDHIALKLRHAGFKLSANPLGVAFNPKSIAKQLGIFAGMEGWKVESRDGMWFSFDTHSSFDSFDRHLTEQNIELAVREGKQCIEYASWVILTFGTSFVYETKDNGVVANCHKLPQKLFSRRRLDIEEIVDEYSQLISTTLSDKNVILTVSPVRHVGDTLVDNSASKAILRLSADRLAQDFENVSYFPSYELLVDDLRDYRFYDKDMVHPSLMAVDYIWNKFRNAYMSDSTLEKVALAEKIHRAAEHHPFHPESEQYRNFCLQQIQLIDSSGLNLEDERRFFASYLNLK